MSRSETNRETRGAQTASRSGGLGEGVQLPAERGLPEGTDESAQASDATLLRRRCADLEEALLAERARCERLEHLATRQSRMATLGEMTAGLAHDFNNMLTPILGAAQLALEDVPKTESVLRDDLEMVLSSAERAGALVRQMILFGQDAVATPVAIDARTLLRDAVTLIRASTPRPIEVRQVVKTRSMVLADGAKLRQALVGLACGMLKSCDGPPAAVVFELFEEERRSGPQVCFRLGLQPARADIREARALAEFDPESLVQLSLSQQGGELVYLDGQATIRLPKHVRADDGCLLSVVRKSSPRKVALLADGDPDVTKQTARFLRALGLRVHTAPSLKAAAERIIMRPNEPDVVIVGGSVLERKALFEVIGRVCPGLPLVVMAQPDELPSGPDLPTVVKPFATADLDGALGLAILKESAEMPR